MNEDKITNICMKMNDIEMIMDDLSLKFDILNVYLENKSGNYPFAENAFFILKNINPDYEKLEKLYSQTQKDVFEILKNIDY